MVYIDTSILAAYYCPEPFSEKAEAFLISYNKPAISNLSELELYSAVSRKVGEEGMNRKDASRIIVKFTGHKDGDFYTFLLVEQQHYKLARDWIGLFKGGLKSLDALHLAVASSEGLTVVTADKGLFKSARALDLDSIYLE